MRAKPGKLENLDPLFDRKVDFVLTKEELENITKGILSKDPSYIVNKSALSAVAKKKGYRIRIQEPVHIEMKVIFEKNKEE